MLQVEVQHLLSVLKVLLKLLRADDCNKADVVGANFYTIRSRLIELHLEDKVLVLFLGIILLWKVAIFIFDALGHLLVEILLLLRDQSDLAFGTSFIVVEDQLIADREEVVEFFGTRGALIDHLSID